MTPGRRAPAAAPGPVACDDGEERGLLADARSGDGDAVAALYDRHAHSLYALARCVLGERSAAEDAVVDAMVHCCGRGAPDRTRQRSVRHELARELYQRCQAQGLLAPAARSRAVLALHLHGEHTYLEAGALTGVAGTSVGHLLRDALATRVLPFPT